MSEMLAEANAFLSSTAPIKIAFSWILYHPEAIVLGVYPRRSLGANSPGGAFRYTCSDRLGRRDFRAHTAVETACNPLL